MKSFLTKNVFLIIIMVIAAALRFYQFGQDHPSLFVDEVSNGYNAYSILKTGRDEYGNFLPLVIRSFGDYNPALSAYLLIPSIAVFGLNESGVRFPSALLGTLTVLLTYFLVLKLLRNNKIALFSSFFLAISPWHLQFSRYDHEANFMVFFGVLGIVLFLHSSKNLRLLIASTLSFGLALNSYQGAKIWIPVLLTVIFLFYHKEVLAFRHKLVYPFIILLIFCFPIILNFKSSLIRGQSVGILGTQKPLETFITGYLSHYNPNFLFTSGDNIGRHSVPGMGELYIFEAPLIVLGLLFLVRQKTRAPKFLLAWLLVAAIPPATAVPTPHALRGLTFIPIWSIVAACGASVIFSAKIKGGAKKGLVFILAAVAFYNIVTYFHLYYKHYPKEKAPDWSDGYKEMVQAVDKIKDGYSSIAISSYYGHPYIFTLFYGKYDPVKYQPQSADQTKFDKFEFFGPSWKKTKPGKALVVTPEWQAHPDKVLKQIYSINGDLRFNISETEQ
ncbi:MAG: glycosyltransferase family 39 protein [Candidatus Curtissbacteria bacterium]|nr:glycosyltransferase family 39 protein [Candidatus Curtissbacteria bacterium]